MKFTTLYKKLDDLKEGLGLAATLIALVVGVINSLADRSTPPVVELSVFTVGAAAFCVWLVVVRKPTASGHRITSSYRFGRPKSISLAALIMIVVAATWGFVYRVQIRYSVLADRLIGGNRVLVSKDVAKYAIKSGDPKAQGAYTLLDDLEKVLTKSGFRIVLMDGQALEAYVADQKKIQSRDQFVVSGEESSLGALITLRLPINEPRFNELKKWYGSLDRRSPADGDTLYHYARYLPFEFFFSFLKMSLPVPAGSQDLEKMASLQIGLRYILAQTLYLEARPAANEMYVEILNLAPLVRDVKNPVLANIYKGVAYYFVTHGDAKLASEALAVARNADPSDPEAGLMRAYVQFLLGDNEGSARSLATIRIDQHNRGPVHGLRADLAMKERDATTACEEMKQVLECESDPAMRAKMALLIATEYGTMTGITRMERAAKMIEYGCIAVELEPKISTPYLLIGYAWALRGNTDNFAQAFKKAREVARNDEERRLVSYWLARSRLELGDKKEAVGMLTEILQVDATRKDASMLYLYAKALHESGGPVDEIEGKLRESLAIDPDNSAPRSLLANILIDKLQRVPNGDEKREGIVQEARELLATALAADQDQQTLRLMGALYEITGDEINSDKYRRLACLRSSNPCLGIFALALNEIDRKQYDLAISNLSELSQKPGVEKDVKIAMIYHTIGYAQYLAGDLLKSEVAYEHSLAIDPDDEFSTKDNLAFVKFDLDQVPTALEIWEQTLQKRPDNADALAGRAIALYSLGRKTEAIKSYQQAVLKDAGYLHKEFMEKEHFWSPKAVMAAAPMIEELSKVGDGKNGTNLTDQQ